MTYSVVNNVTTHIANYSHIIEASQTSIVWRAPPSVLNLFIQYDLFKSLNAFLEANGSMRGITQISLYLAEPIHQLVQAGAMVRHTPLVRHDFLLVGDTQENISAIHIDLEHLSVKMPVIAFWTDDAAYAKRLLNGFEGEWIQSIDFEKRICERSTR